VVKRTPLKLIHFNPTSLINSAALTPSLWFCPSPPVASFHSCVSDSGEFMVIVVAVYSSWLTYRHSSQEKRLNEFVFKDPQRRTKESTRTITASQGGNPTPFDCASSLNFSYSLDICGGAGRVPGRAEAEFISAFKAGDSFVAILLNFFFLEVLDSPVWFDIGMGGSFQYSLFTICMEFNVMWERFVRLIRGQVPAFRKLPKHPRQEHYNYKWVILNTQTIRKQNDIFTWSNLQPILRIISWRAMHEGLKIKSEIRSVFFLFATILYSVIESVLYHCWHLAAIFIDTQ